MAISITRRSLSPVLYGLIPLFCCFLLVNGQSDSKQSSVPIPGLGLLDNATFFIQGFSRQFDSTKNFTLTPEKLFNRVRERIGAGMEQFRSRWLVAKEKMANRTVSLLERIMKTLDRQKDKSGNETSRAQLGMFQSFLDSLRNIVQRLMQKIKDRAGKRTVKFDDDTNVGGGGKGVELEDTDSKTIADLNAALKKLDKATRQKYNEI